MSDSQKWVLYLTSGYDSLHRDNLLVIHTPIFETKPVEQLRGRATRIVRHMDEPASCEGSSEVKCSADREAQTGVQQDESVFQSTDNSGNEKIENN
jgi:hypothetical protein